MRRLLLLLLLVPILALASCGGGESGSPLADALGYLPSDAPWVVAIDTDVGDAQYRALDRLLDRFPFGDRLRETLRRQLRAGGNFERDLKPVLGNPFVVGSSDARAFVQGSNDGDRSFVGALVVRDEEQLDRLLERSGARREGESQGATLYRDSDGDTLAVDDDVVVVASDRRLLERALEQRDGDDRLEEDTLEGALEGLPKDALVRVYANLEELLRSDPDTVDARRVKWVGALRTLGLTASAANDGVTVDFNLRTDDSQLDPGDLPLAAGAGSPSVVRGGGDVVLGLRDARQLVGFAESAARAVNPSEYADYERGKRQLERQLGISFDRDVLGQMRGDVSVDLAVSGRHGVRAQLRDPASFRRTLAKVADVIPRAAEGAGAGPVALARPRRGQDFYALARPDGDTIVFGVVGSAFVLSDDPARAGRLAAAAPRSVPGAKGSLVIDADAERLVNAALRQASPVLGAASLLTAPLGRMTGSVESSTKGLEGHLRVALD